MKTKLYCIIFLLSTIFSLSGLAQNNTEWKNFEKRVIQPSRHILTLMVSNNQYPLIINKPSVLLKQNFTRGFDSFTLLRYI